VSSSAVLTVAVCMCQYVYVHSWPVPGLPVSPTSPRLAEKPNSPDSPLPHIKPCPHWAHGQLADEAGPPWLWRRWWQLACDLCPQLARDAAASCTQGHIHRVVHRGCGAQASAVAAALATLPCVWPGWDFGGRP